MIAAVEDAQLASPGDLVAEADAARAKDAALGVQDYVGSEGDRLGLVNLLVHHPGLVEAVLHVVDLEPALSGLVAHRAVQRVVDQVELHDGLAGFEDLGRVGPHYHALGHLSVAADLRPWVVPQLHHAEAALARDREPGVIAVVGHLDPEPPGRLDDVGALANFDLFAVDRQLDHRYFEIRASNSWRNFSM